jgi:hypothetical protein
MAHHGEAAAGALRTHGPPRARTQTLRGILIDANLGADQTAAVSPALMTTRRGAS